ncbi:hypothetical protein L226DRAFT_571764 [Lentinus tigrinus ALCF2SS1-7]|uniref:uncharacterized protein n=1 Tax=Lentinus tigrinus ALCF2SS1-7 TaxID=1328758 RepID=UPI0011660FA9|nr:hypothetical protein L226DRAFT_571764 [Lentinus tigrinus ALCF2SS1-7]
MFRSHIKTLQRHFKKVGMAKSTSDDETDDSDDPDDPDGSDGSDGGDGDGENGGEPATQAATSSKRTPNDIWFEDRSKARGKAKGKPTEGDAGDRYQRKYTLFQRRYAIVTRYRILRPHIKILQRLGVNGMSSDEEEEGAPFVRYRVLIKPWRSEAVTKFLRALDALHRRYRKTGGSGSKRGSPPRLRCLSTEESTSKEVPRLPINAYNERWYSEQKGLKRDDIAARPTPYNFDLDVAVIQAITGYGEVKMGGLRFV